MIDKINSNIGFVSLFIIDGDKKTFIYQQILYSGALGDLFTNTPVTPVTIWPLNQSGLVEMSPGKWFYRPGYIIKKPI